MKKYFPQACIVAGRFHAIRIVNHHFLACWKDLDPAGSRNRGLISLMRRHRHNLSADPHSRLSPYLKQHPVLELVYRFKQKLCYLLLEKHQTARGCRKLILRLLRSIAELRQAGLVPLVHLGTLHARRDEIATSGASPEITASPKASIPKWKSYKGKPRLPKLQQL